MFLSMPVVSSRPSINVQVLLSRIEHCAFASYFPLFTDFRFLVVGKFPDNKNIQSDACQIFYTNNHLMSRSCVRRAWFSTQSQGVWLQKSGSRAITSPTSLVRLPDTSRPLLPPNSASQLASKLPTWDLEARAALDGTLGSRSTSHGISFSRRETRDFPSSRRKPDALDLGPQPTWIFGYKYLSSLPSLPSNFPFLSFFFIRVHGHFPSL